MAALTAVEERFVLHWGEMGSVWGVSRTVAQIFALLYLSPHPLTAEEISETLSLARSTVSTGLRDLQSWDIIKTVQVLGDRRDHFEAIDDVWEVFRAILNGRKRREIDPTLAVLRQSVGELEGSGEESAHVREKLEDMLGFFETVVKIYDQVAEMPTGVLLRATELGDTFGKVLSILAKG